MKINLETMAGKTSVPVNQIQYGVFRRDSGWYCRTYAHWDADNGPFKTQAQAMRRLLDLLGFRVEPDDIVTIEMEGLPYWRNKD